MYQQIFNRDIIGSNDVIFICFIVAIFGLIIGFVFRTNKFNSLLRFIKINRSTNKNIWIDAIVPGTYIRIFMDDGYSYQGQCYLMEENSPEPIFILIYWQKLDSMSNVLIDYYKDEKRLIALNTKGFKRIELVKP